MLFVRIFLAVLILWTAGVIYTVGVDNVTAGTIVNLVIAPAGLLIAAYVGISHMIKTAAVTKEKSSTPHPPKKVKPPTAMELYEMEKLKKEQEMLAEEAMKLNKLNKPKSKPGLKG